MRQTVLLVVSLLAMGAAPKTVQGDFNADGVGDSAQLVRFQRETPEGVVVANPWGLVKAAPREGALGILIQFGGSKQKPVFLADADFFGSPIWQKPEGNMMRAQKRGRSHAIAVATESGADELIVWTSKGWKLVPGEDMP